MGDRTSVGFSVSRVAARAAAAALTVLALVAAPAVTPSATPAAARAGLAGSPATAATAPDAVAEWSATASAVIETDAQRPIPETFVWHAFVSTAVYNAVVGIEGRYVPYRWHARGPRTASSAAAAAAAAHRVLLTWFPASRGRLDAAYATSLAAIPEGRARNEGVAFGERSAAHTVASREGDGRFVPTPFTPPPTPGVWRPTPPAYEPFDTAWLGRLRPMTLTRPDQFRPGPPPALTSARYARDLAELKAYGGRTGSRRSPAQTETALFFTGSLQFQEALRDRAARSGYDIAGTARLLAAANCAMADAIITAWDAKLRYGRWRPLTAIRLAGSDGNPATAPDPAWEPLIATPPHPDYLSGHATVGGALTRALTVVLGTSRVDLRIRSQVSGTTRRYVSADDYNRDVVDARVWEGVHSRTADVVGNRAGQRVAAWVLGHYFEPVC
ncbi:vanadium-dependent haloperoxidase [Streptomyces sp. ISL-11]|uniref:vanadium-dependent haloperoxidase n=1 Tax=Streptomyces sp. ISL-11 TaxID=2819174 RepID=UPI001BEC361E|nr:vanadium-dependent haloperoxidase [Streptomyces sp. ISL-11]MBT2384343.1 vanadium-dependent haloperoxidase [Streptomyces sp. ISL-11]